MFSFVLTRYEIARAAAVLGRIALMLRRSLDFLR